jgi:Cu/Zn superoxide dismutase
MTDQQSQQRINEAAEQFTDALTQSYKTLAERGVSAQEGSAQVTEVFFNQTIKNLRAQAEENRQATQQLADHQQRQAEATRTIAQESVGAYMETEKAEGHVEREGTEGHKEYFRKVIEETNRRASGKA